MEKPTPKSQRQLENLSTGDPYDTTIGKPSFNEGIIRGNETSYRGTSQDFSDNAKDFTIGLLDIDSSIMYYFKEVIKPSFIQDNQTFSVPILYSDPERWKSVQEDGFYRNQEGKIMVPLITYRRTSIEKNRNLANKLDANLPHNFAVFESTYSRRNSYDNFSVLNNRFPTKELHGIIVPDYVTITYECILFTNYMIHMNNLIESINFASDSYWGDPERFKFRARIDNFSDTIDLTQGEDRAIKSTFNIILHGYMIPNTINKDLVDTGKFYSKSRIVIGGEAIKSISRNQ